MISIENVTEFTPHGRKVLKEHPSQLLEPQASGNPGFQLVQSKGLVCFKRVERQDGWVNREERWDGWVNRVERWDGWVKREERWGMVGSTEKRGGMVGSTEKICGMGGLTE